jgi:hypothetical protein
MNYAKDFIAYDSPTLNPTIVFQSFVMLRRFHIGKVLAGHKPCVVVILKLVCASRIA